MLFAAAARVTKAQVAPATPVTAAVKAALAPAWMVWKKKEVAK